MLRQSSLMYSVRGNADRSIL
ncbi:protein of unknown function (plasmid) [Azospirillum baldaniorum]|uniref:Uncharacterized protein n=1 Tax=Azospirillum baldaniorum TaxID=1064539 RepID=A0A9P1NQ61_9PROT|nr:protein of unknown function [Azospirillum baldaniorum]